VRGVLLTDDGWCSVLPDGRERWGSAAVQQQLDTEDPPAPGRGVTHAAA